MLRLRENYNPNDISTIGLSTLHSPQQCGIFPWNRKFDERK